MTALENLELLRAFLCTAESGSISAGARRMRVSQPTMSRHLRALEKRCNVALLRRNTHGMSLTETGQRLLVDARALLSLAEEADQRLRADQTALSGHLRVFSMIDAGQFIVTPLLTKFLQTYPKVTAELTFMNQPSRLIEEGCDVALLGGKITDERMVVRHLCDMAQYLVASSRLIDSRPEPKRLSDLKSWPWVSTVSDQRGETNKIVLCGPKNSKQMLPFEPVLSTEGVTSLREAVRLGLGLAVLPEWLVQEDLHTGRLVRVLPKWKVAKIPVHIAYDSHRMIPKRVRAFIDFAAEQLPGQLR